MGEGVEEFCDCLEGEVSDELIEVSIHALAGGTEHRTFKLKGNIGEKEVLILVDSGSTHCFLDEWLATHLQLQLAGTPLVVKVANGDRLESRQLNKPLEWEIQGYKFQHHFNTLRLGSCDAVLRVDWLAKFSPIEFDFRGLNMRFHRGKNLIELRGESGKITLKAIKGSRLAKWRRKQEYGITAQLHLVEEGQEDSQKIPAEVKGVLEQYRDVFAKPQGLPPTRNHDQEFL
ncbi:uncharacterized protein [Coffea arabica]|uniref:Uncharacterized protein n=1 Tax=Coffea arabica TaxID=13443 RepID=A0ABM4UFD5_COFAR